MMLPPSVRTLLDVRLEGVSRTELARRAGRISLAYRDRKGSAATIRDDLDVLAYAVARMPATYAASHAALSRLAEHLPDFAPASLLDLGAGPGTATLAALDVFPSLAKATLIEANERFRSLAGDVLRAAAPHIDTGILTGNIAAAGASVAAADLVIASYVLVELDASGCTALLSGAAKAARGAVVLVEPGTPAGFERLRTARTTLLDGGYATVAPCPGGGHACPMIGSDWCHFTVRLSRSRDHKLAKGADVPFEDERFAYIAASRQGGERPAMARVLAAPSADRGGISLKLCTAQGLASARIERRHKALYKTARRTDWGDPWEPPS